MANKPIIDIDVNAEQFKAFYELFQEYHAKLEAMPADWKKVDAATKKAATAFGAISGAAAGSFDEAVKKARSLTHEVNKSTHAQKQFHKSARSSAAELKKMAGFAGSTAKHIFGIGKYLFKLGALGSGVGLLGGFGLRELGEGAVNSQRSARGLGVSVGQYKAFSTDFKRFVDPSLLSNVANQQNSYQGRVWLGLSTGLNPMQVANMRPDQVSERLMLKAHDWWKNTPAAMRTTENMQARGFLQSGLTMEEMRRLGNTSRSTLMKAQGQYARDSSAFNLPNSTVTAWYKFTRELSVAGNAIENVLTKRLSALGPVLGGFVNSLTKDAEKLINGVLTPANMDRAAAGIKEFAQYLGSPDFRKKVSDFASAIGTLASVTVQVAKWLGGVLPHNKTTVFSPSHALPGSTPLSALPNHVSKPLTLGQRANDIWKALPGYSNGVTVLHPSGVQLPNSAFNPNYNPGNLRAAPGVPTIHGFAAFPNEAAGYKAMANLLRRYPKLHHADTIASIIKTYAPASDHNDDKAYIANVSRWTGFGPNQHLNLNDSGTLSRLMAAMVRQEHGTKIAPQKVQVIIANKTGSSVAVSANALGY
ncbi:MAG: hypothetical protein KGL39_44645 [Patescibacteria group bacterium]|nr:hypothetical protein [Patescibacteria group bacterium]